MPSQSTLGGAQGKHKRASNLPDPEALRSSPYFGKAEQTQGQFQGSGGKVEAGKILGLAIIWKTSCEKKRADM